MGELSARHTGKPVENGKAWGHITKTNLPYIYVLLRLNKSKLPGLTKLIELDQNTNVGHPSNNSQVYPVTQVNLWKRGIQGRGKGDGEGKRGWGEEEG